MSVEEIIRFENNHYFVKEPINSEKNVSQKIKILRLGDTTYGRHVKIIAQDGSAKSDIDYIAKQNGKIMFLLKFKTVFFCFCDINK